MISLRHATRILGRGLRLLCPRCGRAPLFRGAFTMWTTCAACDFRFEREQGYFVGAIYFNYAATVLIAIPGYFVLNFLVGPSVGQQLALWGAFCVLFPLWFFRYSKGLWLALDHLMESIFDRRGAEQGKLG